MKKNLSLVFILITILFSSCSSDDSNEEASSVSATVNGKEWKPTKPVIATLIKIPDVDLMRFDINFQDDSSELFLAFESEITTNNLMPLKAYNWYNDKTNPDKVSDALFLNSSRVDGYLYTEHSPVSGKITITAMDSEKKTISGTFNFTTEKIGILQTKIVTPEIVEVTNGVFKNLSYTIITTP
ncbi:DUF6252 family protein [Flavobacterium sp. 2]|uniref:DUF6252 family protein n=1 Tax=Flavobacterium sp. 2 TaxID=308053 RepID=UPI003CEC9F7B